MGAFMVIHADITDPEQFMKYGQATPAVVEKYGGRYRSMRGELEQLEGSPDNRKLVISEWPSMQHAREFWNSPEYAAAKKLREGAAEVDVYLVEITAD